MRWICNGSMRDEQGRTAPPGWGDPSGRTGYGKCRSLVLFGLIGYGFSTLQDAWWGWDFIPSYTHSDSLPYLCVHARECQWSAGIFVVQRAACEKSRPRSPRDAQFKRNIRCRFKRECRHTLPCLVRDWRSENNKASGLFFSATMQASLSKTRS